MKNLMWTFALLGSLVFLAFAYYMRSASVRVAIDARLPWVGKTLGPYVRDSGETVKPVAKAAPVPAPEAVPMISEVPPAAPTPAPPAEPEVFDLKKLAANRAAWPAKVKINKAKDFPAVVNGKVVGSLIAPAGTEVGLVTISGGKLGVEYQGGGAWLFVEETDVIARTGMRPN